MYLAKEVGESLTYEFAKAATEMKSNGREIISLGLGEPDFPTPSYILDATIEAMKNGFTHYSAPQGLPELRELIAQKSTQDYGVEYVADETIVLPGIKAALFMGLASILEPFDKIVVITPYYVSYPAIIKLAEPTASIINIKLNKDYSLNMDALIDALNKKPKCILVNTPHNPTGTVFKKTEVEEIVKRCAENDVYIISDEVYEKLTYCDFEHVSFARYPDIKNRLIVANGYSKSHAMTGWRLGYAIGPKDIIKRMNKLQQHINTNTCTFVQKGACSIYKNEPSHIEPYVRELQKRAGFFHNALNNNGMFKGIKPKAGFFYFADISLTRMDSNSFCIKLLRETGIATTPGIAFGCDWDDHIRFSLAVQMKTLEKAVGLLEEFQNKIVQN